LKGDIYITATTSSSISSIDEDKALTDDEIEEDELDGDSDTSVSIQIEKVHHIVVCNPDPTSKCCLYITCNKFVDTSKHSCSVCHRFLCQACAEQMGACMTDCCSTTICKGCLLNVVAKDSKYLESHMRKEVVIKKILDEQNLTICGITRNYKLLIDPHRISRTCIGTTEHDTDEKIGGKLQYWSPASLVTFFVKAGHFKATFSVLLPTDYALTTFTKDDIPADMDKVILLALWLAPCKQLHCIGTVNGGAVQELPKYNSWVTAPYIDLSEDMEAMWTKYMFYIDYQGPLYRVDGSRRYVKE